MKNSSHILTAILLGSVLLFTPSIGFAQDNIREGDAQVPNSIQQERELPSRYPYCVEDALRNCEPESGFWVDLGAGQGQVSIPLIEATDNPVVMIDPNRESMAKGLAVARERGLENRLSAVVGVAENMPLLDDSVDFVVSRGSIFFWDDQGKGLQEVYRVLRPGGSAYIGGGAGSEYPSWAAEKLIEGRIAHMEGDDEDAQKWRRFIELRQPEQMRAWAEASGIAEYTVMGEGPISSEDERVGQGIWITFTKPLEKE
jgi:SAM-dependent methyltransferase